MVIIFPAWPGERKVDSSFEKEEQAAKAAGFRTALVDSEIHFGGSVRFTNLKEAVPGPVLYRGWILKPEEYSAIRAEANKQGYVFHVSSEEYLELSYLPNWYNKVKQTPHSIWMEGKFGSDDLEKIAEKVMYTFDGSGVIVKDYLKSQKHNWHDACFIRDGGNPDDVERVVGNFLKLQDNCLFGGLVFRKYVDLKRIGVHPKSKMPLSNEWRAFFWYDKLISLAPYWSDGAVYENQNRPHEADIKAMVDKIESPFFSADVAEREDGGWELIEVGDGGTSGLPDSLDPTEFYRQLYRNY